MRNLVKVEIITQDIRRVALKLIVVLSMSMTACNSNRSNLMNQEYLESIKRDAYFEDPSLLGMKLEGEFKRFAADRLTERLEDADENTVVTLLGAASLYGFVRISELVREVELVIRGRLLVLFPGTKNENNYRLLDARDGWNYLANGITLHGGGYAP